VIGHVYKCTCVGLSYKYTVKMEIRLKFKDVQFTHQQMHFY